MSATFSVAQQYGEDAGSASLLGATGSLWYFKQATSPGTSDYNTAGSNIPAGQNSFGLHFRPYFSTSATNTFSNIRFYNSTTWTSTTYGAVGTSTNGYTQATSSSTAIADGGASSVGVPTGSATDAAIAIGSLTLGNASGYGPSYLRVQLTTNSSAPAGDTPYGGQLISEAPFKPLLNIRKVYGLLQAMITRSKQIVNSIVQLQRLSEVAIPNWGWSRSDSPYY